MEKGFRKPASQVQFLPGNLSVLPVISEKFSGWRSAGRWGSQAGRAVSPALWGFKCTSHTLPLTAEPRYWLVAVWAGWQVWQFWGQRKTVPLAWIPLAISLENRGTDRSTGPAQGGRKMAPATSGLRVPIHEHPLGILPSDWEGTDIPFIFQVMVA